MNPTERNQEYYLNDIPLEQAVESYFDSLYKHNSLVVKSVGDFVVSGEKIAVIGNSGEFSSGPHLHFELWHNGSTVNPEDYIIF